MSGPGGKRANGRRVVVIAAALLCGLAAGSAQAGRYTIDCPKVKAIEGVQPYEDKWANVTIRGCYCLEPQAMKLRRLTLVGLRDEVLALERMFRNAGRRIGKKELQMAERLAIDIRRSIGSWDPKLIRASEWSYEVPLGRTTLTWNCMPPGAVAAFYSALARVIDAMIPFGSGKPK